MRYQAIRAAIEGPLQTAIYTGRGVPTYFDNIPGVRIRSDFEYARINITFGLTTEVTLTDSIDFVRGSVVIRIYGEEGRGPARLQDLLDTAVTTLTSLPASTRSDSGIYLRIGAINGPTFSTDETAPHFMGRIDASFIAEDHG